MCTDENINDFSTLTAQRKWFKLSIGIKLPCYMVMVDTIIAQLRKAWWRLKTFKNTRLIVLNARLSSVLTSVITDKILKKGYKNKKTTCQFAKVGSRFTILIHFLDECIDNCIKLSLFSKQRLYRYFTGNCTFYLLSKYVSFSLILLQVIDILSRSLRFKSCKRGAKDTIYNMTI